MKKLFQNKYLHIGLILLAGVTIGWWISPSDNRIITSGEEEGHELTMDENGVWTCSMHPQIRQNEPGSCPICGMELIPLTSNDNMADPMAVSMSPTAMKLANVMTQIVGVGDASKSLRLNGKVMENEQRVYNQASHIPGRVETLNIDFTGEYVQKGQVIATIYSPDLVTAQQELFEAEKIKDAQPSLFEAARKKLSNWKLTEKQIDQIIANGKPIETLPIYSERSGYVKEKIVMLGDYINQGASLYVIADLSKVWVMFDSYESDMQWISKGATIEFTISSLPGKVFSGAITYIDPVINPKTRVAKLRVEIANSDNLLKPEMFVSGILKSKITLKKGEIVVPKTAVMWTGKKSVVYVKTAGTQGDSFRMRTVTLGPGLGDNYVIKDGLVAGEEIVVNGTFSIDAAAQLAGKPSMMSPEGGAAMVGHNHGQMKSGETMKMEDNTSMKQIEINPSLETFEVNVEFKNQIKQVYLDYLQVKDALIGSDPIKTNAKAKILLSTISKVDMNLVNGEAHINWMKDLNVLQNLTKMITEEKELEQMRNVLSPLSDQLYHTLKKYQIVTEGFRQFCPMAMNNKGAFWLSDSEEILNPYFGEAMLTCGNVEEKLK